MILVDTGPLVALFDPRGAHHTRCRRALQGIVAYRVRRGHRSYGIEIIG